MSNFEVTDKDVLNARNDDDIFSNPQTGGGWGAGMWIGMFVMLAILIVAGWYLYKWYNKSEISQQGGFEYKKPSYDPWVWTSGDPAIRNYLVQSEKDRTNAHFENFQQNTLNMDSDWSKTLDNMKEKEKQEYQKAKDALKETTKDVVKDNISPSGQVQMKGGGVVRAQNAMKSGVNITGSETPEVDENAKLFLEAQRGGYGTQDPTTVQKLKESVSKMMQTKLEQNLIKEHYDNQKHDYEIKRNGGSNVNPRESEFRIPTNLGDNVQIGKGFIRRK